MAAPGYVPLSVKNETAEELLMIGKELGADPKLPASLRALIRFYHDNKDKQKDMEK